VGMTLMQGDGNLVIYNGDWTGIWSTGTWGHDGARLEIANDAMAIVGPDETTLWSVSLAAAPNAWSSATTGTFGASIAPLRRPAGVLLGVIALIGFVASVVRRRRFESGPEVGRGLSGSGGRAASRALARFSATALLLTALLLLPASALAQLPSQEVEYYHTDALGSVRAVTKHVNGQWQVVARHDFMPFGEEVAPPTPPQDKRLFTGKERDNESGLDYFEARYLRAEQGRFGTVDPLTASQRVTDPQSFNRYSYVLNNPLRFLDPDGLDASPGCASDPDCLIVIRVRVLWDSSSRAGSGLTKDDKEAFEKFLLEKARRDMRKANVMLSVTYDTGKIRRNVATPGLGPAFPAVDGARSDSLNVLVTDVGARYGLAGLDYKATGTIVLGIENARPMVSGLTDRLPWSTTTLTHEMMHDVTGTSFGIGPFYDHADTKATMLALGFEGQDVRKGLTHKAYAIDANPSAKVPRR
jgi:RHS repeat-associated protein